MKMRRRRRKKKKKKLSSTFSASRQNLGEKSSV